MGVYRRPLAHAVPPRDARPGIRRHRARGYGDYLLRDGLGGHSGWRGDGYCAARPHQHEYVGTASLHASLLRCVRLFVCLYFATLRAKAIRIVCVCVCVRVVPVVGVNLSIGLAYLLSTSSRTNWIHVYLHAHVLSVPCATCMYVSNVPHQATHTATTAAPRIPAGTRPPPAYSTPPTQHGPRPRKSIRSSRSLPRSSWPRPRPYRTWIGASTS